MLTRHFKAILSDHASSIHAYTHHSRLATTPDIHIVVQVWTALTAVPPCQGEALVCQLENWELRTLMSLTLCASVRDGEETCWIEDLHPQGH